MVKIIIAPQLLERIIYIILKQMQIPAPISAESNGSIFQVILQEYSSHCLEIEQSEVKYEDEWVEGPCKTCKIQAEQTLDKTEQCWSKIHEQPEENFTEIKEEASSDDLLMKIKKVQLLRAEQEAKLSELVKCQKSGAINHPNHEASPVKTLHNESKSLSPRKTKKIQKANPAHLFERH